jgi:hypothetical protein
MYKNVYNVQFEIQYSYHNYEILIVTQTSLYTQLHTIILCTYIYLTTCCITSLELVGTEIMLSGRFVDIYSQRCASVPPVPQSEEQRIIGYSAIITISTSSSSGGSDGEGHAQRVRGILEHHDAVVRQHWASAQRLQQLIVAHFLVWGS